METIRVGHDYRGWFIHCHPFSLVTGRYRGVRWGLGVSAESLLMLQSNIDQKIISLQEGRERSQNEWDG